MPEKAQGVMAVNVSRAQGESFDEYRDDEHQANDRSWSFKGKMRGLLGLMWLGMIVLMIAMTWNARGLMYEEREQGVRNIATMGHILLERYHQSAESGEFSEAEARQHAFAALASMRYGKNQSNYVFAFDGEGRMLSHPHLETGRDIRGFTDADGKIIFNELLQQTREAPDGMISYRMAASDGTEALPKIAHAQYFAPWDAYLAAEAYTDDINASFIRQLVTFALFLGLVGGALTFAFILLYRNIYRGLGGEPSYAIERVGEITAGNLDRPLSLRKGDHDSLLYHIEQMRTDLAATINTIRDAGESIDRGARDIANGNNDLSSRTEQQAAALQETSASMSQLTQTVRQNSELAEQAAQSAANAVSALEDTRKTTGEAVDVMEAIRDSSGKINEIITLIDSIAFQTNLLALNASVEAARAGEHGRGFAVVASEVRNLAGRSSNAANDIRGVIDRSGSQVGRGTELVKQIDDIMQKVVEGARLDTQRMRDIVHASQEQSNGIEQVNDTLREMDKVTQQNASLVQDAAAAASSLEEQTRQMKRSVSHFSV